MGFIERAGQEDDKEVHVLRRALPGYNLLVDLEKEDPVLHHKPADTVHQYQCADYSGLLSSLRRRGEDLALYLDPAVVVYLPGFLQRYIV